jgi:hypothetical protein
MVQHAPRAPLKIPPCMGINVWPRLQSRTCCAQLFKSDERADHRISNAVGRTLILHRKAVVRVIAVIEGIFARQRSVTYDLRDCEVQLTMKPCAVHQVHALHCQGRSEVGKAL